MFRSSNITRIPTHHFNLGAISGKLKSRVPGLTSLSLTDVALTTLAQLHHLTPLKTLEHLRIDKDQVVESYLKKILSKFLFND